MNTVAQGGTIEVIHGIEVRDPYRWLEDRQLPDTEDWINRQRRLCDQYFMQDGICAPLKQIVIDTLAVEVIDQAARVGERVILRKQARGQEQAAIWLRSDEDSEDTLLVDPTAFGANISVSTLRSSPDGSLLAYGVRASGSDAMETHIVDIATGATLPDHLPLSYLRGFAFDVESKGFYYCADPVERAERLSIKYHHFGEACSSDLLLFSTPWAEHRRLVLLANRETLAAVVTELAGAEMVQDLYLSAESNNTSWTAMYRGMRGRRWPILAEGRVFLLDFERTRNGSLTDLRRSEAVEDDERIFPLSYAPVLVQKNGETIVVPMRYACRLGDKPANYDFRYPGTYNARRDSLTGFWKNVYGRRHAVMVISGFFENVPKHLYESRELIEGEKQENLILQFAPRPSEDMLVACIWDLWKGSDQPDLLSFAAITDEPPPEVAATGHQRCVIAIEEKNLDRWLSPGKATPAELNAILDDRARRIFEHQIAA